MEIKWQFLVFLKSDILQGITWNLKAITQGHTSHFNKRIQQTKKIACADRCLQFLTHVCF